MSQRKPRKPENISLLPAARHFCPGWKSESLCRK